MSHQPDGMRGSVPIYIGLGLVCLFLTPFVGADPRVADGLVLAAIGLFAGAGYLWIRMRRDPYDLRLLREVHEQEEARSIELEEPEEYDSVYCPHCHNVYSAKLPACPHCGRSPAA